MEFLFRVEKYRPKVLTDLISHKDIISTSKVLASLIKSNGNVFRIEFFVSVTKFVNEGRLPHLLLYGPPGTGKTTTILACARQMYTEKEFASMVLEVISFFEWPLVP